MMMPSFFPPPIMTWFFTNLIAAFLLPPLNLLLVTLAGLLLWRKMPRFALFLLSSALILLWLLSTPFIAESLLQSLESPSVAENKDNLTADVIVVLSGGSYFKAPEYGDDTVSSASLQRLRYAAKLYRKVKSPILLTGGTPLGSSISEARQMKLVLEQEFSVPVQWIEEESDNTMASARNTYKILQAAGYKRIYLVTHAWHMPRSRLAFQHAGFEVVAAPTAFTTHYQTDLLSFLPKASALLDSQIYMHEMIGILWYRLKF